MFQANKQSGFTLTPTFKPLEVVKNKVSLFWDKILQSEQSLQRKQSLQFESGCRGFTLIEMIVSLAVFSTVITIAVGALLVLVATSDRLQEEQNIMVNIAFALDSVTREIRTGTDYYCTSRNDYGGSANIFSDSYDLDDLDSPTVSTQDCSSGRGVSNLHGVAFTEAGNSITGALDDRIVYFYDESAGQLLRKVGDQPSVPIVSSNIYIHDADFFVTGSTPQSAGAGSYYDQASVTVFIEASATSTTLSEDRYRVQTSVSQRTLDI